MICTSVLTLFLYIGSIALLPNYFQTSYITWDFILKVCALTLVSWLPLQVVQMIIERCFPEEIQKIMREDAAYH
jgi:phosphate starvation-inducible membrane PsiE